MKCKQLCQGFELGALAFSQIISLNELSYLHSANILEKGMNPIILLPAMGK